MLTFTMMGIITPVWCITGSGLHYEGIVTPAWCIAGSGLHYEGIVTPAWCITGSGLHYEGIVTPVWCIAGSGLHYDGLVTPAWCIAGSGLHYDGHHRERRVGAEVRQHGPAGVCLHARLLQQRLRELPHLQQDHHRRHDRPHHR